MTGSDSAGAAVKPISSLKQLPQTWFDEGPLARALYAARYAIRAPFDLNNMALGVYAWQVGDLPNGCRFGGCPADLTGNHATEAMVQQLVAEYVGAKACTAVVDGLSPQRIRNVKAHWVAYWDHSNWDIHVLGNACPGDTRSFGGVLVRVRLKGGTSLRFIVAASGDKPWKDQQLALLVAHAIVADLIEEGYIELVTPDSATFILGVDPDQVARFAEGAEW